METREEMFFIPRIYLILAFTVLSVAVCAAGTFMPVDFETANATAQDLEKAREYITNVPYIFGNNFMHCLIMFVPAAGIAYGVFILFNTGYYIEMLAIAQGYSPSMVFISYFLLPFFWMEMFSYAIAMSENVYLILSLMKGEFKKHIHETYRWITLCALILLASAFIEVLLILALGG